MAREAGNRGKRRPVISVEIEPVNVWNGEKAVERSQEMRGHIRSLLFRLL